jgi:hypothetical protein
MKFADIKAGDCIVQSCHPNNGPGLLRKVDRVTNTQIIVNGSRYRKADGGRIGEKDAWHSVRLMPATPELLHEIRQYAEIESAKRRLTMLGSIGTYAENRAKLLKALPHIEAAIAVLQAPAVPDSHDQIPMPLTHANP